MEEFIQHLTRHYYSDFYNAIKNKRKFIEYINQRREYLLTGNFVEFRENKALTINKISYVNTILDQTVYPLIVKNVNPEIKKNTDSWYTNNPESKALSIFSLF